jgi:hypothetical protein
VAGSTLEGFDYKRMAFDIVKYLILSLHHDFMKKIVNESVRGNRSRNMMLRKNATDSVRREQSWRVISLRGKARERR